MYVACVGLVLVMLAGENERAKLRGAGRVATRGIRVGF